jgi:hypothetical protein
MQSKKKSAKNVMHLLGNIQESKMPPKLLAKAGAGIVVPNKVPSYKNPMGLQKRIKKAMNG